MMMRLKTMVVVIGVFTILPGALVAQSKFKDVGANACKACHLTTQISRG